MQDMERVAVTEQYILEHFDEALERRYIEAYCQPVIRIASGQICGMEALARWNDPVMGVLTPDKFIGVLERNRRIHELDSYIVRQVCERFPDAGSEAFVPVSINLSRLDYELCDIFEVVDEAVRANKVLRSQLCIEITESVLNSNDALMRRYIRRFQRAGYQVWMDDFGSGYSSLNVLKDYHFDELKIDMAFLSDFGPRSKTILASVVNMAKQIGIQTLTEGVETEEQFEFLRNVGCEKAQGNLFGNAMPYGELPRFAREHGLSWESPRHRKYYDDIGKLNVLSATPFLSAGGVDPGTGRDLNSIALAVIELNEKNASLLYVNDAFEQTAAGLKWSLAEHEGRDSLRGIEVPLEQLALSLRHLLEETQSAGTGRMNFVQNDDYYEVRTKRLASYNKRCGILTHIVNLSQGAAIARQTALDEGLRQIYAVFERVSVIDLDNDRVEPLFLDPHEEERFSRRSVREAARLYAENWVFPEDRERYLRFADADTLAYRVERQGSHSITSYFRTLGNHGAYAWKCFTVLKIHDGVYYVLVRDTQPEMRELESYYLHSEGAQERDGSIPVGYLWDNVKRNSPLKFFWKDTERRFLGASQSFLDYYGFDSLNSIAGKTDEDMGWHLHPEDYRDSELRVLREGVPCHHRPGNCIVRGENRSIVASKMPIYDSGGEIIGLMGYFSEAGIDRADTDDVSSVDIRMDKLTGLLNTRGLDEDMYAYRDEYDLRRTDFVRIEICVEELGDVNRRFGYDFGDSMLRAVANALVTGCGQTATVGRLTGSEFIVFAQCANRAEADALTARIRAISAQPQTVEGTPFTVYLSVGAALYSETEDLSLQTISAKLRRLTENVENIPTRHLREHMSNIFFLYESLPLAFAVYKVSGGGDDADATILYVNRKYAALVGRSAEELVGERVRKLFPMQSGKWMDMACRAAAGEELTRKVYYESLDYHMSMTANQIIGQGYCAFTYRVEERL